MAFPFTSDPSDDMNGNGNAAVFQACNGVQVNGGNFNVAGRDNNTQTTHYHPGSTANNIGYAHNLNTGTNNGYFSQGGSPPHHPAPPPPQPNPYQYPSMGAGAGRYYQPSNYPAGGWPNRQGYAHGQPTMSPPPGSGPSGSGPSPTPPMGPAPPVSNPNNPFRQHPQRPPPATRASSNEAPRTDDVDDNVDDPSQGAPPPTGGWWPVWIWTNFGWGPSGPRP